MLSSDRAPGLSGAPAEAVPVQLHLVYVWAIASAAALGGLLFGYDWVVIGGAKPFFQAYFHLDSSESVGWANSCALIGCLVGSLLAGGLSDRFGRKKLLIVSALLFAGSSIATGWSQSFSAFVFWRILGGVAIGIASNVSPTYIAEISPALWRGRLVALNQLTIVIGILAAQIVNWQIARPVPARASSAMIAASWNGQFGWRWMFTAVTAPALVFLLCAVFLPESPRWLVKSGLMRQAGAILGRIGGAAYAQGAVEEIGASLASEREHSRGRAELLSPSLRRILGLGIFLAVLQQWSGINVLFNYAEEVYRSAGYGVSDVMFNIVITGAINLAFTLVALGLVDRFGRRPLMLVGCAGIGISHLLIGLAYRAGRGGPALLVFTLAAIGCYGMSLAPVTWVLISEIFPNRIRGAAVSIAVSALWIACFILTFTFPMILQTLGSAGTFWLYAAICFAGFAIIWLKVPETKGKTLEEIEKELAN